MTTLPEHTEGRGDAREDDTVLQPSHHELAREDGGLGRISTGEPDNDSRLTLAKEELVITTRRVASGAVDIHKRVETEHVRQNVPFTREEVTVERVPAPPGMGTEMVVDGDETRIPLVEEELVVQKRLVVREMLVVRKRQIQEEQVVEADLRRERADIQAEGGVEEVQSEPQ